MKTVKILGLDIGASSVGWMLLEVPDKQAGELLDDNYFAGGKILDGGVRIFPAGKDAFNSSKEKSLAETRRKARSARRRLRRNNKRKEYVRQFLVENEMLPPPTDDRPYPLEDEKTDPLELRAKGISKKLELHELGRALYHLAQRRGFLSTRKKPVKVKVSRSKDGDDKSRSENGGTQPAEEKKEKILAAISTLQAEIKNSGLPTLGAYLWNIRKRNEDGQHVRIRRRYTRRSMYQEEFNLLWKTQAAFHPDVLTTELKEKIEYAIFFQRKVYWRQSTIGKCEFEKDEFRCFRADRLAQEFRFLQEINNLKYTDPGSGEEIRVADNPQILAAILEEGKKNAKISFDKLRKIIALPSEVRFNLESGKRKRKKSGAEEEKFRKELKAFETDAVLRKTKYFGKNWDKLPEDKKNEIVRILLERPLNPDSEKMVFDNKGRAQQMSEAELRRHIEVHWRHWLLDGKTFELTEGQIDEICDTDELGKELPKRNLHLSRKALRKVLPFMRQGALFSGTQNKDGSYNDALHQAGYKRRDEEDDWQVFPVLPQVHKIERLGEINNPVVRRIVNETRRLINAIIKKHGRPDRIHLELAREAKASQYQRQKISAQNRANKKEREEAATYLRGEYINPTRDAILRCRLWYQQGNICPYTGNPIGWSQLFAESEVDIDHILPYSRTQDDSQMNKVVCFAKENREKGNRTPFEWLSGQSEKYDALKRCIQNYPKPKKDKFYKQHLDEDEFTSRQLNDTKYASRYMMECLRCLFTPKEWKAKRRILTVKGTQTADLRYYWGLNETLHSSEFLCEYLQHLAECRKVLDHFKTVKGETMKEYLSKQQDYNNSPSEDAKQPRYIEILLDIEKGYNKEKFPNQIDWFEKELKSRKKHAKNRADHRHHAVDALVIALTDTRQLKRLGEYKGEYKYNKNSAPFPLPWASFRQDAKNAVDKIFVSHRPIGRVRGGLHDDTNYGPTHTPTREPIQDKFVIRKTLTALSAAEFFKIRDPRIKELVFARLAKFGITPVQKGKREGSEKLKKGNLELSDKQLQTECAKAFALPLYLTQKNGKTNLNKHLSEIKKVRLIKTDSTLTQLKEGGPFVKPGSTHHICLFERTVMEKNGKEQQERYPIFVTRLEANQRLAEQQRRIRAKRKELQRQGITGGDLSRQVQQYRRQVVTEFPVIQRFDPNDSNARFLFTFKSGELFRVKVKGEEKWVIFKTAASTSGQFWFIDVRDARKEPKIISKSGQTLNDIVSKLCVDRLGNLSKTND